MNYYDAQCSLVLLAGVLYAFKIKANKIPVLQIAIAYFLFSAIRVFMPYLKPYALESERWQMYLEMATMTSLIYAILICSLAMSFSMRVWINIWQVIGLVNWTLICVGAFFGKPWGVLANASMSGCLAVTILPLYFLLHRPVGVTRPRLPIISIIGTIVAVILTKQSQPLGLLCVLIMVFLVSRKRKLYAIALSGMVLSIGYWIQGGVLFQSSGRVAVWNESMAWWSHHSNPILGAGFGTYSVIGAYLSSLKLSSSNWDVWFWMHSDWLQILFENGCVGLLLTTLCLAHALRRSVFQKHSFQLLCCLILYSAWGLANMPLRYPLSALLGAILLRWSFFEAPKRLRSGK